MRWRGTGSSSPPPRGGEGAVLDGRDVRARTRRCAQLRRRAAMVPARRGAGLFARRGRHGAVLWARPGRRPRSAAANGLVSPRRRPRQPCRRMGAGQFLSVRRRRGQGPVAGAAMVRARGRSGLRPRRDSAGAHDRTRRGMPRDEPWHCASSVWPPTRETPGPSPWSATTTGAAWWCRKTTGEAMRLFRRAADKGNPGRVQHRIAVCRRARGEARPPQARPGSRKPPRRATSARSSGWRGSTPRARRAAPRAGPARRRVASARGLDRAC